MPRRPRERLLSALDRRTGARSEQLRRVTMKVHFHAAHVDEASQRRTAMVFARETAQKVNEVMAREARTGIRAVAPRSVRSVCRSTRSSEGRPNRHRGSGVQWAARRFARQGRHRSRRDAGYVELFTTPTRALPCSQSNPIGRHRSRHSSRARSAWAACDAIARGRVALAEAPSHPRSRARK